MSQSRDDVSEERSEVVASWCPWKPRRWRPSPGWLIDATDAMSSPR